MRFEKFLLDNYIATEEGQVVYNFFQDLPKLIASEDEGGKAIDFINSLLYLPIGSDFFNFSTTEGATNSTYEEGKNTSEEVTFEVFEEYVHETINSLMDDWKCSYRDMTGEIPSLSLSFFYDVPEWAIAYLYPVHFDITESIFTEFSIPMPPIPGVRQYKERCFYYIELCKVLHEFRQLHGLSSQELHTFLYGFARKFTKHKIVEALPSPNRAWIVGANNEDSLSRLPNIERSTIQWWAGQKNMQVGDVIFMYETAPHSVIRYAWRAISEAYDDPFHFYSGKIWLADPQKLPQITYQELRENSVFANNGLVRAHMQGCGRGPSLKTEEYNALLSMLEGKGFDTAQFSKFIGHTLPVHPETRVQLQSATPAV